MRSNKVDPLCAKPAMNITSFAIVDFPLVPLRIQHQMMLTHAVAPPLDGNTYHPPITSPPTDAIPHPATNCTTAAWACRLHTHSATPFKMYVPLHLRQHPHHPLRRLRRVWFGFHCRIRLRQRRIIERQGMDRCGGRTWRIRDLHGFEPAVFLGATQDHPDRRCGDPAKDQAVAVKLRGASHAVQGVV